MNLFAEVSLRRCTSARTEIFMNWIVPSSPKFECWSTDWLYLENGPQGNIKVKWGPGNGNPLQCSCLENPRDGGGWWAAIYGVAQGWTWLKQLSSSSSKDWALAQENWCLYKKRDRYKTLCAHTQKRSHVTLEKRKRKRKGREEKRKRKICHTRNQPWC